MKKKAVASRVASRRRKEDGELSDQKAQFALEYAVDFNGARAARSVGCSEKCARVTASKWLTQVNVQEAVKRAVERRQAKTRRTAEEVEAELDRIAFSRITDYVDFGPNGVVLKDSGNMSPELLSCISEVSEHEVNGEKSHSRQVRFKLHDKLGALRTKAEILKMLKGDAGGEVQRVEIILKG